MGVWTAAQGGGQVAFLTRYPIREIPGLGKALSKATQQHLAPGHPISQVSQELKLLSHTLAELYSRETTELEEADYLRDQLVLALYHGLKMWSHRVDLPRKRLLSQGLLESLLPDGYGWIDAPYQRENDRMAMLLEGIHEAQAQLEELDLSHLVTHLTEAETRFHTLLNHLPQGTLQKQVSTKTKILVNSFHRKLDLYVALVREKYDPRTDTDLLTPLLAPLRQATERLKKSL